MQTLNVKTNRKPFTFLQKTKKRVNLLYGGAGSGKSWATAQFLLLEKMYKEKNIRILITRKTRPALKKSAWLLMNDLLRTYELPVTDINRSDLTITINNNQMFFVPLDDPEKLKSFEKINYVWGEEATEFTRDDYLQLNLRCRGKNSNGRNRLFYSFNPMDEQSFLKLITENPPDNTAVQHSTYKDNAFLEQDYIDEIEGLEQQDETYYKIYGLGIWASPVNIIYANWDIVKEFPRCEEIGYGLDFGFNLPTALLKIGARDDEYFEEELLYQTKLTNAGLIVLMQDLISEEHRDREIRADSEDPSRIEEIGQAGFNILPCTKGKGSVIAGIGRVKSKRIHITEDSVNLIAEKRSYKWKQDRNGNILDEPVKFKNHLMDAERYYLGELLLEQTIDIKDLKSGGATREMASMGERIEQDF